MSEFVTYKFITNSGGTDALNNSSLQAKSMWDKMSLKRIAESDPMALEPMSPDTRKSLEEALSLIELRCLDLFEAWHRDAVSNELDELRYYCSLAFDIRRVLPLGVTEDACVKGTIHLAAVAVLGDRVDDFRRYLDGFSWPINLINADDARWPDMVFFRVADSFLRIVCDGNGYDHRYVDAAIASLRQSQKQYEREYLQRENGVRQVAALELVALYQLAKAVELLSEFVRKGVSGTAPDDVDFHLTCALRAADSAGTVELALLLRWIGMAARALIRPAN